MVPDIQATASRYPGLLVKRKAMTAGITRKLKTKSTPTIATDMVTISPNNA